MAQLSLFAATIPPRIDAAFGAAERIQLEHGAWLELTRGWLHGDAALFELLRAKIAWRAERRVMYERTVDVPRLYAVVPRAGAPHPVLEEMRAALDARFRTRFERLSLALYRDGKDSVAWHGDYVARRMPEALVATVSLGGARRFLLRPTGGGKSMGIPVGAGDLLVMGGSCQRTYQHAIPKVAHAEPRIAVMFRPIWSEKDPYAPPTDEQALSSTP